jgi:glycosyltransferase involved in cell wall biosynthesis
VLSKWSPGRVLHLVTCAEESAAQVHIILELAKGLDPREYETYCCFLSGSGSLASDLRSAGVPTYDLRSKSFHKASTAFSFHRLLCNLRPAILHDHYGGPASRAIARLAGVHSIILHAHSRIPSQQRRRPWTSSSIFADRVIASSRAVASCIRDGSTTVVYPGLNQSASTRRTESTNVIGTVGRLSEEKGTRYLIRAMGLLRESFPALRLEVVGAGPEREKLEALVVAMELTSCVRFLGWQQDVQKYLEGWDLCVLPSIEEGFGLAAVEAMASGLPVIASRVGGLEEVIVDGETGWLVEPRNAEALAQRIRFALHHGSRRNQVAEAGRQFAAEHFSAEAMVEKIREIYDDLRVAGMGNNHESRSA